MTGVATGKLRVYIFLSGLGLLAALALGRPELAALAGPFALFAGLGLALMRPVEVKAVSELDLERQLEERHVTMLMEVSANRPVEHLELVLDLDDGLVAEAPNPILIHLSPGERRELEVRIRCAHWGTYEVGNVVWRVRDAFGLFVYEGKVTSRHRLKVYPHGETLRAPTAAARDAGVLRQPGCARPGRRDRVRGPTAVHVRRPRAARELAGHGAPR